MKLKLLYILLFFTGMVYAYQAPSFYSTSPMLNNKQQNYYVTPYNNSTNSYNSTNYGISVTPSRRIGYTTKYGNAFGTRVMNPSMLSYSSNNRNSYVPLSTYGGGPRRSKERPFSGNMFEDLVDWLRMRTDGNWPGYVDDDYWEEFLEDYPEYRDYAEEWFKEHGQNPPWLPDDPYPTPIGNCMIPFLLFSLTYVLFKVINQKKT